MGTLRLGGLLWLILLAFGTADAHAEFLVNGGFETDDLTDWTWTPDVGSEPTMTTDVAPFGGSNAFRANPGNNSGAIGGPDRGGTLSQLVALDTGVTYVVSAGLLAIENVGTARNADGGTITALLGGTVLHTFDIRGILAGELFTDSFSAPYTATATGLVPFELRFTRNFRNPGPNVVHYADNLSVQVIPEPPTIVLTGLGVLGLLSVGWRQRRAGLAQSTASRRD